MKRKIACVLTGIMIALNLGGCGKEIQTYDNFQAPEQETSTLIPVSTCYTETDYEGENPTVEKTVKTYSSEDGLCVIEQKDDYFDVTLDYEKGSYYDVGAAYAETIRKVDLNYEEVMEPYLYENIKLACPNLQGNYNSVQDRLEKLKASLPVEYQQEMEGFAVTLSDGITGFANDGKISYEEAMIMQMIPDALRGTNCSAMSVWGDKSATGKPITARILEWRLGSSNQMCSAHCVLHMKNGDKSLTSISVMGLFDIITAVNNDGVFAGILDVGSDDTYTCEGKTCYTYDLRYALENYDNAEDAGNYMIKNSSDYTFSHNIIMTDKDHSYCVEDCVNREKGSSVLRDNKTPMHDSMTWDSVDSMCVVNSFATKGSDDILTGEIHNLVRYQKFNKFIASKDKLSITDVKNMLTCERTDSKVHNIHSDSVYHIVILDYSTNKIEVAFTGTEGVKDHPQFTDIGGF